MGQKYTSQSASGYNNSPPPDDGTTVANNKITWSGIKTKLGDPVKTEADAINTQLVTALDTSTTTTATAYTTAATDHQKPIEVTGTTTISLGDATTMGVGYQAVIVNTGTGVVTVALITATDALDGVTNGTVKLHPGNSAKFVVQSTHLGYKTVSRSSPYIHGADVASAATINLDFVNGDVVDVTGTTTITAITLSEGKQVTVRFTGSLGLTNGASLVLPGNVSLTTVAGDFATFRGYSSGVVRCINYQRINVQPDQSLILLAVGSASASSSVDISGVFSSTYDEYLITISELVPATDATNLLLRVSEDGGSTFKAGATDYAHTRDTQSDAGATPGGAGSTGDTAIVLVGSISNSTTDGLSAEIRLWNPAGTSKHKFFHLFGSYKVSANTITNVRASGVFKLDTNAINAVRLLMSSGNIASGNVAVYGIRKTI